MTDWTLVSRRKGGRFYRPVANVPTGLDWNGARDLAARVSYDSNVQVWYVPRETPYEEDRDNVLEDNGRRVPIRWDAAPHVAVDAAPTTPVIRIESGLCESHGASGECPEDGITYTGF